MNKSYLQGVVTGAAVLGAVVAWLPPQPLDAAETALKPLLIKEYYEAEAAVAVSPHGLRKSIEKGTFNGILVDVRSQEEYEEEHIVGAINIPAYKNRDTSAYGEVERIVHAFQALPKDKEVIVYCYSTACMSGRKVGKMLADHGIYVKHLNVGWNEWRHNWKSWNHAHEWNLTRPEDYVVSGKEPGAFKGNLATAVSCEQGEFSC